MKTLKILNIKPKLHYQSHFFLFKIKYDSESAQKITLHNI